MSSLKYSIKQKNVRQLIAVNNPSSLINELRVLKLLGASVPPLPDVEVVDSLTDTPLGVSFRSFTGNDEILQIGMLENIDTSLASVDDPVYFDVNGEITLTPGSERIGTVLAVGVSGRVYINIGGGSSGGGQAFTPTTVKTSNYSPNPFELVLCDTSGGAFSLTLPSTPTDQDAIQIQDLAGNFSVNNLEVISAKDIMNDPDNWYLDIDYTNIKLVYSADADSWFFETTPAGIGWGGVNDVYVKKTGDTMSGGITQSAGFNSLADTRIALASTTTLRSAGNETFDCSLNTFFRKTGGNATITLSNLAEGQAISIVMASTGSSYAITWAGETIRWSGGAPTPTTTASQFDYYTILKIGGIVFGFYSLGHS